MNAVIENYNAENYIEMETSLSIFKNKIEELKNELKIDDILKYEENILVVIPYESKELFPKLSGVNKLYK